MLTTNILVIDDEKPVLDMLSTMLNSMGYEPHLCEDAEQGLEDFSNNVYDVVVSDVNLPGIDGIEMVQRMRKSDPTMVPIIMTGRHDQETAVRAIECGARSFLRKPFTKDELQEKLDLAIRERHRIVETRVLIGDLIQTRTSLQQRLVEQDRRLTDTERYLHHLLDAAPFAILSTNMEGCILTCNSTTCRCYGYSDIEILGRDIDFVFGAPVTPGQKKSSHRRQDGSSFPVLIHQSDILVAHGKAIAHLYVIEDQTTRDQLESQLVYAQRLSILGEMAPRIAHEFKVPLQIISGYSELAQQWLEKNEPEEARASLANIIPASRQMQDLVHQIANLGKPTESVTEFLDLKKMLEETLEYLQPLGIVKYCTVVCDFADDLPQFEGDPTQIHQLLRNLIINAVHAMEEGQEKVLTLTLRAGAGTVTAIVADTGAGIAPEHLKQIFNPFFTTKPEGKGTGLGLPIVNTIVERHGGTIEVESTLGVGTSFYISFPALTRIS